MKVYISGKIGEEIPSPQTIYKFAKAEVALRRLGHQAFNPTTSGLGTRADVLARMNGTTFYEEIMLLDLQELKRCDAVLLLPDWYLSPGAKSEASYAQCTKKPLYIQAPNGQLIEVSIFWWPVVTMAAKEPNPPLQP